MSAQTKTTNGHATAEDVAQSTPAPIFVPDALAKRIKARIQDLEDAQAAQRAARAVLDDTVDLSRELLDVPADHVFADMPGGAFAWLPPRPAPQPPTE